jgi:hypothetical protein
MTVLRILLVLLVAPAICQASEPKPPQKTLDKSFVVVGSALIGATVYDIESTFAALDKCPTNRECREANAVQRPFIARGRYTAYAANAVIDATLLSAAYGMKKSKRFAKVWWMLPLGGIIGHAVGGTLNIRTIVSWR